MESPSGEVIGGSAFLDKADFGRLIEALQARGYTVVGPTVRDGVISVRPIDTVDDLATGIRDEQEGGHYRLVDGDEELSFEYVVGADGPKRYFFPPRQKLFELHIEGDAFAMDEGPPNPPKLAFVGVRPCEVAAIAVQDRVFGIAEGQATHRCETENYYRGARQASALIAVNCTSPGGTCFCDSMGTGPAATEGYDLAMTDLRAGFILRAGSELGRELLDALPSRPPTASEKELEELKLDRAREHMGRQFDTEGVAELLRESVEHPHWEEVAKRCLGCGNARWSARRASAARCPTGTTWRPGR